MKKLYVLLLLTNLSFGQSYEFKTVDVRTPDNKLGWEIREIPGEVRILPDNSIEITTPYNHQQFTFMGELPFYFKRETMSRYVDTFGNDVRIRWDWSDRSRKYIDMYFMSNLEDSKYFRLCLKKCE